MVTLRQLCIINFILISCLVTGFVVTKTEAEVGSSDAINEKHLIPEAAPFFVDDTAIIRSNWEIHVIDQEHVSEFVDVQVDRLGSIHMCYQNKQPEVVGSELLKYAFIDETGVTRAVLESNYQPGYYASLVVDSNSVPHIISGTAENASLNYLIKVGNTWTEETCDGAGQPIYESGVRCADLAVGATPYVVEMVGDISAPFLNLAIKNAGVWDITTIDSDPNTGWYPTISINPVGGFGISYENRTTQSVIWNNFNGSQWTKETVFSGEAVSWISSVIDGRGIPYVCYRTSGGLMYSIKRASIWNSGAIDISSGAGYYASMAINQKSEPGIAYVNDSTHELRLAQLRSTDWVMDDIYESVYTNNSCALAYDRINRPYVAFTNHGKVWLALWLPDEPMVMLTLNRDIYRAGDDFSLQIQINAPSSDLLFADMYIILDVLGSYYFYPSWGSDLDKVQILCMGATRYQIPILDFTWPDTTGSLDDLKFWGVLTHPNNYSLYSNVDTISFGFAD